MVEIVVVGAIIIFILVYNNTIDKDKFIADNEKYFNILREDDYDFLVYARYGEEVDPNQLFRKRIFYAILFISKVLLGSSSMRQEPAAERTAGCLCHGSRVRLYSPGRNRERRIHPPPDRQYRKRRLPDNLHGPD